MTDPNENPKCPKCGNEMEYTEENKGSMMGEWRCPKCGHAEADRGGA